MAANRWAPHGAFADAFGMLPSLVGRYVASHTIEILTGCPTLFKEATALSLAAILLTVLDKLSPLHPLVLFSARGSQVDVTFRCMPSFALLSFGDLVLCLTNRYTLVCHRSPN